MSRAWIVPKGQDYILIEGTLDFDTVVSLLADSRPQFAGKERLEVDLKGVGRANSAGLALLLEWVQLARRNGTSLRLYNPPESLMSLAAVTNVSALLPVAQDGA